MDKQLLERMEVWLEEHREEFVRDVCDLIAIRSVQEEAAPGHPFGEGLARMVDKGLELGERYGLATDNDEYYSVSFLLPGTGGGELAMLSHIDIVPEGGGWSYPPYEPTVKDGHIIGRGSHDNKGPAVAILYALRLLRWLGIPMKHTVRAIWGANEETGMADVSHYLTTHAPPDFTMVADARFPLCYAEKGIMTADLTADVAGSNLLDFTGGTASNAIPDQAEMTIRLQDEEQKSRLGDEPIVIQAGEDGTVTLKAEGKAAHVAEPERGVSAIQILAEVVTRHRLLTGPAAKAVAYLADAFADSYGEGLGIGFEGEIAGKTTAVGGYVRVKDGRLVQNLNVRYAVEQDQDALVRRLEASASRGGFEVSILRNSPPFSVALDNPRVKVLLETSRRLLTEEIAPYTTGGGTHARVMPNAVPYGPTFPAPYYEPSLFGKPHGADEAVRIDRLLGAIKIYAATLIRLDEVGDCEGEG